MAQDDPMNEAAARAERRRKLLGRAVGIGLLLLVIAYTVPLFHK